MSDPDRLRQPACRCRGPAERTVHPTIWGARLRSAEDYEAEAARLVRAAPLSEAGDD